MFRILVSILYCFFGVSAFAAHPDTQDGERFCTIANPPAAEGENYWGQIYEGLRTLQRDINQQIPARVSCPNSRSRTSCDYCNRAISSLHQALDQQNALDRKFCRDEMAIANATQSLQNQTAAATTGGLGGQSGAQLRMQETIRQGIQSYTEVAAAYRRIFEDAVPCQTLYIAIHHYCGFIDPISPEVRTVRELSDRAKTYCYNLTGWAQNAENSAQQNIRRLTVQGQQVTDNLASMSGGALSADSLGGIASPAGPFYTSNIAVGTEEERRAAADRFIRTHRGLYNTQCATYVQHRDLGARLPDTREWRRGENVLSSPPPIGTPVATFNYQNSSDEWVYYGPSGEGERGMSHTGIYMGTCNRPDGSPGISLLHSYDGQDRRGGAISCVGNSWPEGERPDRYYTIRGP